MPKLKTKKSAAKRFTKTGGGKLARNKAHWFSKQEPR
jgi:ribosomal protein L35